MLPFILLFLDHKVLNKVYFPFCLETYFISFPCTHVHHFSFWCLCDQKESGPRTGVTAYCEPLSGRRELNSVLCTPPPFLRLYFDFYYIKGIGTTKD